MPIVFCNVGWMKRYDGIDGDSIERGGSYNKDANGHEVCNFSNIGGAVYGYVQPTGRINVERLGAKKGEDRATGVTVVWTAGPATGGTVVVGWYKNATVFREPQQFNRPTVLHQKNGLGTYWISALATDSRLLEVAERTFIIPRAVKGGIGQSNVWYADKPESLDLIDRVLLHIDLIAAHTPPIPDVDVGSTGSEGNPRLVAHLQRERNSTIIKKKKAMVLAQLGSLCCEACGFNFAKVYGERGANYCEVHHLIPLHKSDGIVKTQLSDLAIVCSNCHRVLHRENPMLSIDALRKIIRANSSSS